MEKSELKKARLYWKLFASTLSLSAFTVGGGYVIVPLMKKKFVDKYGWLTESEMLDMTAIAQSAPGPIAVNASIIAGYRIAGVPGALIAVLGTVLPPLVIIAAISAAYTAFSSVTAVKLILKCMQIGVAAVIADVVTDMVKAIVKQKRWITIAIMALAFVCAAVLKLNVMYIVLAAALAGVLTTAVRISREKKDGSE